MKPATTTKPAMRMKKGTAMINYTIVPGDTLTAIARRFNVSISSITDANGIDNPDLIEAGDSIIIPGTVGVSNPVTVKPPQQPVAIPGTGGAVLNLSDWLKPPKLYYALAVVALGAFLFSRRER